MPEIGETIKELERLGVTKEIKNAVTNSPVPKADFSWKLVSNFKALNKVSVPDTRYLINARHVTNGLPKGSILSKIDLANGFWSVPLTKGSMAKTAFTFQSSPGSLKQLQSFLGHLNFIRDLIPGYAKLAKPLYSAMKGNVFNWTNELKQIRLKLIDLALSSGKIARREPGQKLIVSVENTKDEIELVRTTRGIEKKNNSVHVISKTCKSSKIRTKISF